MLIQNFLKVMSSFVTNKEKKPISSLTWSLLETLKGKNVILVDDMVDTAGTLTKAADL